MPRGRAWTQAEVGSLLALVGGSGEAALLMASTSRPNEALWQQISRGLAAAGYSRSVAQCRSKWKALKQAFHSERETRRRAGLHSPRLPPHYRAMKSIWKAAGRPVFRERRLLDSQGTLLSPLLWRVKDEPESCSGVASLLQSVQQLLVQILQTSRQQQALLESLASDTVSHLHLLSHSLVQKLRRHYPKQIWDGDSHMQGTKASPVGLHIVGTGALLCQVELQAMPADKSIQAVIVTPGQLCTSTEESCCSLCHHPCLSPVRW
ncbi:UNVERIFIED_CONTAM: hypothetical protein H355_006655 [Colinus virginianus]|nr:hypothetical protein H355_006655 [Colinus virginianus]